MATVLARLNPLAREIRAAQESARKRPTWMRPHPHAKDQRPRKVSDYFG